MPAIDLHVFSDFACPWCYIGTERIDRLAKEYDIKLQWHPYQLRADTPTEGMPMTEVFPAEELADKLAYVTKAVHDAGLPFHHPDRMPNTHLAHEAACFADKQGKGDAYHRAVLQAHWVDGKDIGDPVVLVELGEQIGLEPRELAEALAEGTYAGEVDWAIDEARAMGIRSVPTFVFGTGAAFAGAQPYDVFRQVVEEHVLPALTTSGNAC